MSDTTQGTRTGGAPLWKRRRFWLGGGALAGLAAFAAVAPQAWAHAFSGHGFGGHGHRGFGAQILKDPDAAKRHASMAVEWVLRGVGATDQQKQQAKTIGERLVDELAPLAAKHHENRRAIAHALSSAEIDREALEQLRRQELTLADQASKLAVDALADVGEVLTPQQRQELVNFAHRFHGGNGN
ncbi:MAG: Spy/CpxP family protein refolding chaperone [Burkholderiales bacterium]